MRNVCRHCLEPLTKDEGGLCASCRQSMVIGMIATTMLVLSITIIIAKLIIIK